MTDRICAFTGHRLHNLPFGSNEEDERCVRLKKILACEIEKLIENEKITRFITGMATGVDMFAAEAVLELEKKYPLLALEAAIPCETQADKWSKKLKIRYSEILEQCNKVIFVEKQYTSECMHRRNRYMINKCSIVIAVWDGKSCGTGKTVCYALEMGKPVIIINPNTLEISREYT